MRLPEEILEKIEEISQNIGKSEISKDFRKISDRYLGYKNGESLLNEYNETIAYAIARMPATYAATKTAYMQIMEKDELNLDEIESVLDVGAGTGAATLAVSEFFDFVDITCLEREEAMLKLGSLLLGSSENSSVQKAKWDKKDILELTEDELNNNKADIVATSYMLNEFDEKILLDIVNKLWKMTNKLLIIVDPGTPNDYKRMMKIKEYLEKNGGFIVAPCTMGETCSLPDNDWCHFSCRVERTKLQKSIKMGEVPYEDEKFTYLAISRESYELNKNYMARVIRHPIIKTNMVEVKLCLRGQIITKVYTKKDKDIYKIARKAKVGDLIPIK